MATSTRLFDYSRDGDYSWKIPNEMSWKKHYEWECEMKPYSIRIDKYAGAEEQVVIPNEIMDRPVRAIGERAFWNNKWIERVVIPHYSVIVIGESAFRSCDSLYRVEIGGWVIEIGDYAFSGCPMLYSVIMGGSVTTIGKNAFAYTPLSSIVIPNSVKTIGEEAFFNCKNLKTIQINKLDAIDIGHAAFWGCEAVETIRLLSSNSSTSMKEISKSERELLSSCGIVSSEIRALIQTTIKHNYFVKIYIDSETYEKIKNPKIILTEPPAAKPVETPKATSNKPSKVVNSSVNTSYTPSPEKKISQKENPPKTSGSDVSTGTAIFWLLAIFLALVGLVSYFTGLSFGKSFLVTLVTIVGLIIWLATKK